MPDGQLTPSGRTRLALMRAAEELFLERGVEAVSLREIAARGGQRNNSAVLYHFHDKRGLIEAVLDRHSRPIQEGWLATLDFLDAHGQPTLHDLLKLMVRPIAQKLDDTDGGTAYIALCAQLLASRTMPLVSMGVASTPGALALTQRIGALCPSMSMARDIVRHVGITSMIYTSLNLFRPTLEDMGMTRDELVDHVTGALEAMLTNHTAPEKA